MKACVYRHFDSQGRLLYVGATSNPEQRLTGHKYASSWYAQIERIDLEYYSSKKVALAVEKKVISAEKPLNNVYHLKLPKKKIPKTKQYNYTMHKAGLLRRKELRRSKRYGETMTAWAARLKMSRARLYQLLKVAK